MRGWKWLWLPAVALFALGSTLVFGYIGRNAPLWEFQAARLRWEQVRPQHYRLVMQSDDYCWLDLDIANEEIAKVNHRDDCTQPARTVSDIFKLIERGGTRVYDCGSFGCACRTVVSVYGIYNDQYGYPQSIRVSSDRTHNYLSYDFWSWLMRHGTTPNCQRRSDVEMLIVHRFEPQDL